jgi:alkylation response protein AidB-like acyl-CoA dehydrogenase
MTHYQSNLRDLEFNLFEVFDTPFGIGPYSEVDAETARGALAEIDRMARNELAASYADTDRRPPTYDPATFKVTMPKGFANSFRTWMDAEFWRFTLPEALGGTKAPHGFIWSFAELVLGANAPVWMYASGPSFANILHIEGNDEQREWAKIFVERKWGSTMILTEPDAGSDVGAGRTKAIPQPDGSWHIEGVKRFITSGEHDMAENIIHYVLARPEGAGPGTKGLSLFVVPKFHFDPATGELKDRNGVFATNVEHKMGIKASTTCEMTFGGHGVPAKGWLVGDKHEGIRQMFLIIENARMMVGTKAIATLSTGYLNALAYAKERVQGADLLQMTDKTAPRVTITHHPDIRRSLLLQKSYSEGLRALVAYAAHWFDKAVIAEHAGDEKAAAKARRVNDFLLPLVKGCGSERAFELLGAESLQTFGGSGFLQDYPLEQYVRDSKIDSLYEGTTAIQSMDLFFRKVVKDNGRSLLVVASEIQEFLDDESGNGQLKEERALLAASLADIQSMLATFTGWLTEDPRSLYKVGLHSRRLLLALGDLIVGWLLLKRAEVALRKLEAEPDFYAGVVASARFFAREVLPRLASDRRVIELATLDPMDLPEAAF